MPTPRERMTALLSRHNALRERRCITGDLYINPSSFSTNYDGLTIQYYLDKTLFVTICTFQTVENTEHFSLFVSAPPNRLTNDQRQALYPLLTQEVLQPLVDVFWRVEVVNDVVVIINRFGESLPVKGGRRLWNRTLPQDRTATQVWYNQRQSLPVPPTPPVVESSLIISELATIPAVGNVATNLDGDFHPDNIFTPDEVA